MNRFILLSLGAVLMSLTNAHNANYLTSDPSFNSFLERFEEGTRQFISGDPGLWKENVSRRADATIMGAWGAFERGWDEVGPRYDWAAARFQPSDATLAVEYLATAVNGRLAYTVAIERSRALIVGQSQPVPMALRVTHVFRKERGEWKLMHRQADPLIEKTAPDTVLQGRR